MSWVPPEHDRARELRDHASAQEWGVAIEAICARHAIATEGLAPMPTGSDVVWGMAQHVVKLTAPCWTDEIAAERANLEHVAGRLSVATPGVVASGELEGWPYVVMTRVPGRALGDVWPALGREQRLLLAGSLGRVTAELHALETAGYHGAGEWPAYWKACRRDVHARHARDPDVPAALLDEIEPFLTERGFERATGPDALAPHPASPLAALHTELLGEHVLVSEHAGQPRICALIDFADGRVGPREYDLTPPAEFVFKTEPGAMEAFLAGYGLPAEDIQPALGQRLLAWNLCHRFGRLERLLEAVAPAQPATLGELARCLYVS